MATTFSTLDALSTLCKSIPEWNARLDELNGQIAKRQIELARLTEKERPPTRSLRNKGSTESLRPKEGNENPFASDNPEDREEDQVNPVDAPTSHENGSAAPGPGSPAAARQAAMRSSPPPKANSNPRPSPGAGLARQSSQPAPQTQPRPSPAAIRKRKTESLASAESLAPKYRTRSMIIVYYDSAVQTAFEDLVKFVSGSRNAMRKGKMAAKMAEMRRAAELEVDADDDDDDDDDDGMDAMMKNNNLTPGSIGAAESDGGEEVALPKLKYVSTRQMGPLRDFSHRAEVSGGGLSLGLLKGYRRAGMNTKPDVFDELDKGLEWCQGQCEHAAHQFLRDGDCSTEIANIKRRLEEVRISAEKEMACLKVAEAMNPTPPRRSDLEEEGRGRVLKAPLMRKEVNGGLTKNLEVDDKIQVDDQKMEVDDNEDDMELPPKLVFKRSRDVGY
ncbi:hypothetical protein NA56DRAFT_737164 [Hyaloscypha hepaticicola]|uniref:Uncharacterized protein n=1 Tax=Hyaloscypha hepaticicola TaxID=2082293 RepID=A0A2J6PHX7_9HELO|nr:hypothetical protein NA56DRAFT_737164 [Hyaloscypha hepaticicola]